MLPDLRQVDSVQDIRRAKKREIRNHDGGVFIFRSLLHSSLIKPNLNDDWMNHTLYYLLLSVSVTGDQFVSGQLLVEFPLYI